MSNLAAARYRQGELAGAINAYRQAIHINPDVPEVHCELGKLYQRQGEFTDALAAFRRGHELGSQEPRWRYPSGQWVQQAEGLLKLGGKLTAILNGRGEPADPAERLALAELCEWYKNRRLDAVRFYAGAFAAEPTLAEDLRRSHRYNAACAACLAAGQVPSIDAMTGSVGSALRHQARRWLRADLDARKGLADSASDGNRESLSRLLRHWQEDPDLAGVRDPANLATIPQAERRSWLAFWGEVDDLQNQLGE